MLVTVFRSRLRPDAIDEYMQWVRRMSEIATSMPGYLSHKVFTAEDGERVTIVEFEGSESQDEWASHPEHVQAKAKGRDDFYAEYKLQVCEVVRESGFVADDKKDIK